MAKKRTVKRKIIRSRSRIAKKTVKRSKNKSSTRSELKSYGFGFGFGTLRPLLNSGIRKLTSRTGINVADEIAMPVALYFIAKGKVPLVNKIPMSRQIAKAGLVAEGAYLGARVGAPLLANNFKLFGGQGAKAIVKTSSIR